MPRKDKLDKLVDEIATITQNFVSGEIKHPPEDLAVAMKEIASMTVQAVKEGNSGLYSELRDDIMVILEIYRVRLNKKTKAYLWQVLNAAMKVAASLVK